MTEDKGKVTDVSKGTQMSWWQQKKAWLNKWRTNVNGGWEEFWRWFWNSIALVGHIVYYLLVVAGIYFAGITFAERFPQIDEGVRNIKGMWFMLTLAGALVGGQAMIKKHNWFIRKKQLMAENISELKSHAS